MPELLPPSLMASPHTPCLSGWVWEGRGSRVHPLSRTQVLPDKRCLEAQKTLAERKSEKGESNGY